VSHGSSVCAACSMSRMRYPAYSRMKEKKRVRHDKTLCICIHTASYPLCICIHTASYPSTLKRVRHDKTLCICIHTASYPLCICIHTASYPSSQANMYVDT
jgi:hypothetical protein